MPVKRQAKVLVVDDDAALAQTIAIRLRAAGYLVLTAECAGDAAEMAVRQRPDAIVVDTDLPRFTGLELHHCLQFADRSRGIPVVYLTRENTESIRRAACELGAKAVLTKPFDSVKLIGAVKLAVDSRRVA